MTLCLYEETFGFLPVPSKGTEILKHGIITINKIEIEVLIPRWYYKNLLGFFWAIFSLNVTHHYNVFMRHM